MTTRYHRMPTPAHSRPHPRDGGRHRDPDPDTDTDTETETAAHVSTAASALVRWGAFSCALVPVTLLTCGVAWTTALGAGAGLSAVTAVCGALLRRSGLAYAPRAARGAHGTDRFTAGGPGPHRGRHSRTGTGLHRGGRHWGQPGES